MANPARAVPGGGMIPSGGGVDSLRAFVQSPDFQNLPTAVQQQILDRLGPAATGLIPSPGGGMIPPPPREPPVIRIPGGEPDVPPGGRLPPPDAPARLPGPEPDAPPPKRRGPWEALGLLGLGGLAAFWPGDDPNLDAAATPIAMEPGVGGAAGALSARSEPGQNPNAPLISPRHRARINHWAKMTGLAPTQVAGMFSQNPDQALAQLNLMSMDRSHSRQTEAADRWRATAMLAGGSHNINSGNRGAYNMLNELEGEDRDRALMYMSPAGPMAAAVDARNAEAAGKMAQQAMTQFFVNNPAASPEARAAANMQLQNADAQQSAAIQKDAERLVDERADDQGWFNLATRALGGGVEGWDNTLLTIAEEEAAVRKLMARYPHLSYDEASQQVAAAADRKTRQPRVR